ncbi:uncharacterized protein MONOS_1999 [Monocercomonoides exilis]|uniref:uncharacterized protein n=1 Tax=Monocercomonoides exilis TaxID=2049356 RepID=UPI0035597474|nr:hypothetical protein MONOS_1999 [Monocercomonoides exilis]|eukprot:MONOS_1999.1-p1 / transcript=MONOS_1999.1 / gene=MONOS_1999 / organism=Monocercomonoides_exilis_PA203 / gene_product=unspecified product / transcript_product=unspecified product / location=Mono_scaffold00038:147063-148565(+) / protein_length=486 / sequence_SO=supercontig / SO=protein_coding / is_pseudo=false
MARILIDGKARLVDATNFGEFSKKTLIHAVNAVKSDRDVAKVGRPSLLRKEKKEIVTDVIKIEAKCGTNLTVKKTKELIENAIEDEDSEISVDASPKKEISKSAAYSFLRNQPELKLQKPKILDSKRLAASCQDVLKPWYEMLDDLHSKFIYRRELIFNVDETSLRLSDNCQKLVATSSESPSAYCLAPSRVRNATLVAAVASDGFSLPTIVLWPSSNVPEELTPLLSPSLDVWCNTNGWMNFSLFERYSLRVLLPEILERKKRMKLTEERCSLFVDSHISRANPIIWRKFMESNVDVITFVPHTTHISQPLDRGVFAVLKSVLNSSIEIPQSSTASSNRKALADILPQALHSAFAQSVIKNAFDASGVLFRSSGPVSNKLPKHSSFPLPSYSNRFDFYGKLLTNEDFLEKWEEDIFIRTSAKSSEVEEETENIEDTLPLKSKKKRVYRRILHDDLENIEEENSADQSSGKRKIRRLFDPSFVYFC